MTSVLDVRLVRALELLGNKLDPEIEQTFLTLEERILAQALENVELAERKLREIQELVCDVAVASSNAAAKTRSSPQPPSSCVPASAATPRTTRSPGASGQPWSVNPPSTCAPTTGR